MKEYLKEQNGGEQELNKATVGIGGTAFIGGLYWLWNKLNPILEPEQATANTSSSFDQITNTAVDIIGIGAGTAAVAGLTYGGLKIAQLKNEKLDVIQVAPSQVHDIKSHDIEKLTKSFFYVQRHWFKKMIKGKAWARYLIIKDEKGIISFRFLVPQDQTESYMNNLKEFLPHHSVRLDTEFDEIPFFEKGTGFSGHMVFSRKEGGYGISNILSNNMGSILYTMPKSSVIDVRFTPTDIDDFREDGKSALSRFLSKKKKTKTENMDETEITKRFRGHSAFEVTVNLWSKKGIVDISRQIEQHTKGVNNSLILKKHWVSRIQNGLNYNFILPRRKMIWNDNELAQLLFTPPTNHQVMEQIETIMEKLKPKNHELRKGLRIGYADHESLLPPKVNGERTIEDIIQKGRPIYLDWETLDRHGIIPGMTGSGKGATLGSIADGFVEAWVLGLIEAGMTQFDPHELANLLVMNRLLEQERQGVKVDWSRVRCYSFNPENEYPTPLNLLHFDENNQGSISAKAAEATQIILSAFPGDLSKSAVLLQMAIEALLSDGEENHTIAQITKVFRDTNFLSNVIDEVDNEYIKAELEELLEEILEKQKQGKKPTSISAIVTRLFPFLGHKDMQRSFAQANNVISGKRSFEKGEIVLIDFKNANDDVYKLTAAWVANNYFHTAKAREAYTGKHHYMIVDEAQMFKIERFADIIQQTRKFRFGLWQSTQDVDSLDQKVKDALEINCGFQISLRQKGDVSLAVDLMNNTFTEEQIKNLPDNHGCLYSIEGSANVIFPAPAFIWEGKRTKQGSDEYKLAYNQAKEKFYELVKRDCKHYKEVDKEIRDKMQGKPNLTVVSGGGLSSPD
jgi:hypothetical protein